MTQLEQLVAERDRLLVECAELRDIVSKQFRDLAKLRLEQGQLRGEFEEMRVLFKRWCDQQAIKDHAPP